ncbi:unnamed protein product [Porites evermanni]|uniref:Photolyase/cryptochrome alpha/beta domain-containing protein n=1 Tax=Porites evermanni TaxID=104178 RepID=A0ABN8M9V9_9CNID|nr:unnamed protein product [Porites evermanni]
MAAKTSRVHHTIHWFRKGLRLHDNQSLKEACETSLTLRPIYFIDPDYVKHGNMGFNRWRFLIQSLNDLDNSLKTLGSRSFAYHIQPFENTSLMDGQWNFQGGRGLKAQNFQRKVGKIGNSRGLEGLSVYVAKQLTPRTPDLEVQGSSLSHRIVSLDKELYSTFSIIEQSCDTDQQIPYFDIWSSTNNNFMQVTFRHIIIPRGDLFLSYSQSNEDWVNKFEKPNTAPNSLQPSTTVLSPYVMFGCLSARLFYHRLSDIYSRAKKHSNPPVSLHGQLLWREFFFTAAYGTPNFNKMEGNRVCLQVPWDNNPEFVQAWAEARTGYPFIDAIMTQLRREGWIHHLARHAVACFLTRGDLWISWEEGLKVFEKLLLDHDWSLNAGNWMWLSASAFFHAYFRVYSPVAFGKKTDSNGEYIKKYLPVLKKYPPKYIYEPWTAPLSVQKAAGCVIGRDYPKPIVDHKVAMKTNIERMKKARAKQYGGTATDQGSDEESQSKPVKRKMSKQASPSKKSKKITDFLEK